MIVMLPSFDTRVAAKQIEELHDIKKCGASFNYHYDLDYGWITHNIGKVDRTDNILDAGCGEGAIQFYYAKRCNLFSIDRDDYGAKINDIAMELDTDPFFLSFDRVDIMNYEQAIEYNCIYAASSLEHNEFDGIIKVINRLCNWIIPGGRFYITMMYGPKEGNVSLLNGFMDYCLNDVAIKRLLNNLDATVKLIGNKAYLNQDFDCEFAIFRNRYGDMVKREFVPLGIGLEKCSV